MNFGLGHTWLLSTVTWDVVNIGSTMSDVDCDRVPPTGRCFNDDPTRSTLNLCPKKCVHKKQKLLDLGVHGILPSTSEMTICVALLHPYFATPFNTISKYWRKKICPFYTVGSTGCTIICSLNAIVSARGTKLYTFFLINTVTNLIVWYSLFRFRSCQYSIHVACKDSLYSSQY